LIAAWYKYLLPSARFIFPHALAARHLVCHFALADCPFAIQVPSITYFYLVL
jgi:hypothetical protein